jgi:asparagine synthase (glutamine-hydrolysing)
MTHAIRHRGPDDEGYWSDTELGVHLGHRRLSILDLSPAGRQPMLSREERFVLTFNGEIYNYRSLSNELIECGHTFLGSSDTEVMLAAFEEWGIEAAVKRFNGMFAFGLWDRKDRTLYLARDRIGEKPLYYGWNSEAFFFASELKAIKAHPEFVGSMDPDCAALALRYGYIPTPWSIYRGIFKLIPGTILQVPLAHTAVAPALFSPHAQESSHALSPNYYWRPAALAAPQESGESPENFEDAAIRLDALLNDAVSMRMASDVPVGAFLSGGIDSSTIVALMQKLSHKPVKTFSIGFNEQTFNEATHAKQVARYLGTDHTELYVSSRDIFDVIPRLPTLYDEPFGDSSQIPTLLVSTLCRKSVTVSLSGDGGDELFAGYDRYTWAAQYWGRAQLLPLAIRRQLSSFLSSNLAKQASVSVAELLPPAVGLGTLPQKFNTVSSFLHLENRRSFYKRLMSHWPDDVAPVPHSNPLATTFDLFSYPPSRPFIDEMTALDVQTYLSDDIMAKVDRATMAVSLEARTPFLDHRIVEFALSMPLSLKIHQGKGKMVLRRVLERYVPSKLFDRPKMGFSIPIGSWLRTDLRPWAESLLSVDSLTQSNFLNPEPIRKRWKEHLAGTHNWEHQLWDVLMLQSWLSNERSS